MNPPIYLKILLAVLTSYLYLKPNLVMNAGIHPSLHAICHHKIVYAKVDLKIQYPPPYGREGWHFQKADINFIRKEMNKFNYEGPFFIFDVNKRVPVTHLLRTLWQT